MNKPNHKSTRKADRRIEFTQSLIRDTLFELMETTPVEKITVSRLCEEACINRSTFYLHYKDIQDVIEQITQNYYSEVTELVSKTLLSQKDSIAQINLSNFVFGTEYGIKILRHPEVFIFGEQHKQIDQSNIDYLVETTTLSAKEASYFYSFITYGLMGMTKQMLLNDDYIEMIDNMYSIYRSVIDNGLKKYRKDL